MTAVRRTPLAIACLLVIALLVACRTLQTYPGPERPDTEIAILEGYWRYYVLYQEIVFISAVDGIRHESWSVRLLPGQHWIEVHEDYSVARFKCAFESNFEAQHRYQLKAHSSKMEGRWYEGRSLYKGLISIEVSAPGLVPQTLTVATVCAQANSHLCRQDADCANRPNYRCRSEQGYAFGICEARDR